jgi:NAD(P)-dependent dehydrogenase (short-subunit alcohol dehydrogenase family)
MTSATTPVSNQREPELVGQIVVVIGGSAGIGLETARRARAEGADVIITGRDPDRLERAALELGGQRAAAFDANDAAALERFFQDLPTPIDHVMVTAGRPHYGPLLEMDTAQVRQAISDHVVLALEVARNAARKMRPGARCCSWAGPAAGASDTASGSSPPPPPCYLRSQRPSRSSWRRFASTSSPPDSSTPVVGVAARRSTRRAPKRAAGDAPDRPRRRPRRRRRARRPHHDQHRAHRRDVRHRRGQQFVW